MSMQFWETRHSYALRKVALHPDVKPYLFLIPPADFQAADLDFLMNKKNTFYQMRIDGEIAGIGCFQLENGVATVDLGFLPQYRGRKAKEIATSVLNQYVHEKKPTKIIAKINKKNKRSLMFAYLFSFHVERQDSDYYYIKREYKWAE